jgi:formate dehydrogenase iron-sulfur subunit
MMAKAMLIDVTKCMGCRACQVACKEWNDLPAETTACFGCYDNPEDLSPITWNRVEFYEYEKDGQVNWFFRPVRCMHCLDAPCVKVCPTGALYKDDLGFTAYDESLCNGCGYCTQFCPFDVPRLKETSFLWGKGKSSKCTFCQDRVPAGQVPACAKTCPPGAIQFGEREEMLEKAEARLAYLRNGAPRPFPNAMLYNPEGVGGTAMMYILPEDDPGRFNLPEAPSGAVSNVWQKIIQPLGEVALGATILGVIGAFFITRRNIRMEEVE